MQMVQSILRDINVFVEGLPPIKTMESHDRILFHDAMVKFARAVALSFPMKAEEYVCPSESLRELKIAYYDLSRMRLKYLLRLKKKTWGEYMRYDSDLERFIDITKYSGFRSHAVHAMKTALVAGDATKEQNYDRLKHCIDQIVEMNSAIDDAYDSCHSKICSVRWKKRRKILWCALVFVLVSVITPMAVTIKWDDVGQTGLGRAVKAVSEYFKRTCNNVGVN